MKEKNKKTQIKSEKKKKEKKSEMKKEKRKKKKNPEISILRKISVTEVSGNVKSLEDKFFPLL